MASTVFASAVSLLSWNQRAPASTAAVPRACPLCGDPDIQPIGRGTEREWRGVWEVVDVTAEGFVWRDQTFPSLSAVALSQRLMKSDATERTSALRPAEMRRSRPRM